MIDMNEVKIMCKTPDISKAYYRPFICSGDLAQVEIFLVGINPATPISSQELDLDEYVRLLVNYNEFIEFYKKMRSEKGKTELSRTRFGMNSFIRWLHSKTESSILETNIITYPTENLKLLHKDYIYNRRW